MIRLLHISDVHYSRDKDKHPWNVEGGGAGLGPRRLVEAVYRSLVNAQMEKPDGIAFTGDITYAAGDYEFDDAVRELGWLVEQLGVPKTNVLLIPGNHDADWNSPPATRFARFSRAFQLLLGDRPSAELSQSITLEGPGGEKVRLIGVNSALLESKEDQGMGAVGEDRLRTLLDEGDKNTITVLCLHHHLLPVTHVERDYLAKKRTSVTLDAKAILSQCAERDVRLVLHGHQHQPALACYAHIDPLGSAQGKFIWVSGAGSAGVAREHLGNVGKRHFQLLQFEQGHSCDIFPFTMENEDEFAFRRGESKKIPLNFTTSVAEPEAESCTFWVHVASELERIRPVPEGPTTDNSDLYLFLAKANRCHDTATWLTTQYKAIPKTEDKGKDYCVVEEVCDLYGDHDILAKIRASSNRFIDDQIREPLARKNFLGSTDGSGKVTRGGNVFNIDEERYPRGKWAWNARFNRGIRAFIHFSNVQQLNSLLQLCEPPSAQPTGPSHLGAGVSQVRGIYKAGDHAFVEYYFACSYHQLNDIMLKLETVTESGGAKKVTYLVQATHLPAPTATKT